MTHTDQSRAESAYQDRGWYWIEKEGWGSETIIAPALYKAECDAWYSVEFSGSPTREVKVLEPIRRATTEQSSGVELPEPRGYLDEFGNFEKHMQNWMREEPGVTWERVYTEPQVRALLAGVKDSLTAAPAVPQGWMPIESAPKDGAEIWAFNREQGRMNWISGNGYALWVWADELLSDADPSPDQPTHWMPLPQPPKEQTDAA